MTKQERVEKCKTIIDVLQKIINGADVPLAERINTCQHAIQVLCRPEPGTTSQKRKSKKCLT